MEKKLSERLQDAYMVNNRDLINKLLIEVKEKAENHTKKVTVSPLTIHTVLNDENASAIKIYNFLNTIFDEDWWELEFETIERLLWVNYGVALEDGNRDKIWAIKHLCNSQRPFLDFFLFNQTCLSFNGCIADFEVLRAPTPGMIISTVKAMQHIRPEEQFSREVKKYMSILLINEGIYTPPVSLKSIIEDEFEDLVKNFDKQEWAKVYDRYKDMVENKKFNIEENYIDIQAKRLLTAEIAAEEYIK